MVHVSATCTYHARTTCRMDCTDLACHPYGCATCHHCKGNTCHSQISPPVPALHVIHLYAQSPCHVSPPDASMSAPAVPFHINYMDVRTVQSASTWHCTDYIFNIFPYLTKQINHNIRIIRHPFEPIQVALGSY
jgi:hypothetical protein